MVDPTGAGDAWRAGFLAGLEKALICKSAAKWVLLPVLMQLSTMERKNILYEAGIYRKV